MLEVRRNAGRTLQGALVSQASVSRPYGAILRSWAEYQKIPHSGKKVESKPCGVLHSDREFKKKVRVTAEALPW